MNQSVITQGGENFASKSYSWCVVLVVMFTKKCVSERARETNCAVKFPSQFIISSHVSKHC